ncbi:BadF/BadG/BcrA/BcrD ATPase family protein [Mumia sp. ZJ430]|uniref:N-acetylglucosamine kinase n=1 Tax=Mumia sp. ZJ430 TaxID=2708083 RepID=UPI001422BF3A|nr:BadF/BadG/BcrA/BcrD ATPase family protein [Mumia sp. ZJ430]
MPVLLAVDAGGTSTRAVVVDTSGRTLGYGRAGGGNPVSSGPGDAAESLSTAVQGAIAGAGADPSTIASTTIAMAGAATHLAADDPRNRVLVDALAACGIHAPLALRSDLLAMYCAGTPALDGYAMVAGTGAAAIRVRDGVVGHVVDGMGWLLGDAGSGFSIGHAVTRAVVADLDGRGPATPMTPALLERLGLSAAAGTATTATGPRLPVLEELVDVVYAMRPVRLAQFAPLAFADPADPVARAIVDETTTALSRTIVAAIDQDVDGPLVLGGSVLLRQETAARAVEKAWRARGRTGSAHLVEEGTAGAAVLALRESGATVDEAVFARVVRSLADLR